MKENEFQMKLKKKIKNAIPGSVVLKNNPNGILGIPDLTVLGPNGKYAILECEHQILIYKLCKIIILNNSIKRLMEVL